MKIILVLIISFITLQLKADAWFDSVGYRYYHDLGNEHDGSKFRAYATKKFYKSKFKFAYERKRTGRGVEAGTWFVDHEYKF